MAGLKTDHMCMASADQTDTKKEVFLALKDTRV